MDKKAVDRFFAKLQARNPSPQTELNYTNPYTLLVAVVLSAQMTDAGVNKATEALFKVADTPEKMLKLGEVQLKEYIKTVGLCNTKAKNVIALSQMLVSEYGSTIPRDHAELVKLPGVGRKTANVVLNVVYGEHTMPVDTHVFRVANRTGLAAGKTPDAVEEQLLAIIPKKYKEHAHHWLILHGRYTCKARKPLCGECPVYDECEFAEKAEFAALTP